jgi:hypothetical protein
MEIRPASETDYFIRFLNIECQFLKDDDGEVAHMVVEAGRQLKLEKVR